MVNARALISRLGLTPAARHVAEEVSSWQGVETLGRPEHATSEATLDGVTFRQEGRELGHIHGNSEAHIALSASVFDAVMTLGGADASPWSEHQAIVTMSDAQDAQRALWLFKLSVEAGKAGETGDGMQFQ